MLLVPVDAASADCRSSQRRLSARNHTLLTRPNIIAHPTRNSTLDRSRVNTQAHPRHKHSESNPRNGQASHDALQRRLYVGFSLSLGFGGLPLVEPLLPLSLCQGQPPIPRIHVCHTYDAEDDGHCHCRVRMCKGREGQERFRTEGGEGIGGCTGENDGKHDVRGCLDEDGNGDRPFGITITLLNELVEFLSHLNGESAAEWRGPDQHTTALTRSRCVSMRNCLCPRIPCFCMAWNS